MAFARLGHKTIAFIRGRREVMQRAQIGRRCGQPYRKLVVAEHRQHLSLRLRVGPASQTLGSGRSHSGLEVRQVGNQNIVHLVVVGWRAS